MAEILISTADEIRAAIASHEDVKLEAALLALLEWPYDWPITGIEGSTAEERHEMLKAVAGALLLNEREMPGRMRDMVQTVMVSSEVPMELTYGEGAELILGSLDSAATIVESEDWAARRLAERNP